MVMYLILSCSIRKRGDVCVVTVDKNLCVIQTQYSVVGKAFNRGSGFRVFTYSDLLIFEYGWEQLSRPKHFALFCCPCVVWIAIQAMYEDYISSVSNTAHG